MYLRIQFIFSCTLLSVILSACSTPSVENRPPEMVETTKLKRYELKLSEQCLLEVASKGRMVYSRELPHKGLCYFAKTKKGKVGDYVHLPKSDPGRMVLVSSSSKQSEKCEHMVFGLMIENDVLYIQAPPFTEGKVCLDSKSGFQSTEYARAWFAIKAGRNEPVSLKAVLP